MRRGEGRRGSNSIWTLSSGAAGGRAIMIRTISRSGELRMTTAAVAIVLLAALLGNAHVNGQQVPPASDNVPAKCKSVIGNFLISCFSELEDVSRVMMRPFPGFPGGQTLSNDEMAKQKLEEYLQTEISVNLKCCEKICELAHSNCLCDESSLNLFGSLFGEEEGINEISIKVLDKFASICAISSVPRGSSCTLTNDSAAADCS